jgi:small acid-soluble spore protein F (minor alpha/beta-type SASP)
MGVVNLMARRRSIMSDRLKYELAQELGFADKVKDGDWGNITTREAGSLVRAAIERAERAVAEERPRS